MARRVAVFTLSNDIHALAIRDVLRQRDPQVVLHIVETDQFAICGGMSWSNSGELGHVRDSDGELVRVDQLDAIWWRRINPPLDLPNGLSPSAADLITNDWRAATAGLLSTHFRGTWISEPSATRRAENKLIQLQVAAHAGLRVPATLVSQDPRAVRDFCGRLKSVVVKSVKGSPSAPAYTCFMTEAMLDEEDAIRLAPAIYQEYVPGGRHIRLHVFGDHCLAVLIESPDMDWRRDLSRVTVSPFVISPELERRVRAVIDGLGLVMGVVDLKLDDAGEAVWLEVNPQGQFLFVEGLCGAPLSELFATFLVEKASRPQT